MNRLTHILLSSLIVFLTYGCSETIEYKYNDKPMMVTCEGVDQALLNEALYSFFNDISVYYTEQLSRQHRPVLSTEAYSIFIYNGSKGEADYKNIVSKHSLNLLKELKKENQLWDLVSEKSNLNYKSDFVSCLINNIEDLNMKATIVALQSTADFGPQLLSERLITDSWDAMNQPNFLMYIVLDTYYQYLLDLDYSEINFNE